MGSMRQCEYKYHEYGNCSTAMASNPDRLSKNFNAKGRAILHSLKTGYLQCDGPMERKKYTSTVVWVALCTHWRRVTGKQQIENPAGKAQVLFFTKNLHFTMF